ncbi:MAG: polyprenyl synthetase family protein [Chloroflexota bacterium]
MTETVHLYGSETEDVSLVGERLREIAREHHALLGETLAYVFETEGKRIRPALVMLSGKLGTYDVDHLVTLAASLEVVHSATLVHDDTIDEALTRRGLETVSAIWDPKIAVLVGDFLFAQSAHLAAQLNSVRIVELFSETVMAMSSGELRQYASSQSLVIDEADYFQRITGKTATLFAACCEGAAIVTDQSEERAAALGAFGLNLGLAFQIVDDVLDFRGTEQKLGKPAGNDLRQGTITLPAILYAQSQPSGSAWLADLKSGENMERLIRSVIESDCLNSAMRRAHEYADAACLALSLFPASDAKNALEQLARRVTTREY